jgi:hypothetical protein
MKWISSWLYVIDWQQMLHTRPKLNISGRARRQAVFCWRRILHILINHQGRAIRLPSVSMSLLLLVTCLLPSTA